MVNNSLANSETEGETTKGNDEHGNGGILSGCGLSDDANPYKYYARRRKCNENVQVCEKQKKRESYQRVSSNWIFFFFLSLSILSNIRMLLSISTLQIDEYF